MAIYNREDPRTALPQLEKQLHGEISSVREKCEVVDSKTVYSTEETVVGEWIDGKPIYRKVYIPFTTKSYTIGNYSLVIDSGVDKIIRWDILVTGNNNDNQEVNKYVIPTRYTKSTNTLTFECTATYSTNVTHFILEYTKE